MGTNAVAYVARVMWQVHLAKDLLEATQSLSRLGTWETLIPGGFFFRGDPLGQEATETGLAYAPVSQAHGHHHSVQCFVLLYCITDQFGTTPGGL